MASVAARADAEGDQVAAGAPAGGTGAARPAPDAGDTDIYYVANLTDRPQAFDARFRVAGRQVEIWHPDTGRIEPAGYAIDGGLTTDVPHKF